MIVADVKPDARIAQEEIFGPVLAVLRAKDLDEALEIANGTQYALTGGLYSRSPVHISRVKREFVVGNLYINRPTTGAIVGRQPFGGWKRSSLGPTAKTGGPNYLLALRRWRDAHDTSVDAAEADYRRWWDSHFSRVTDQARFTEVEEVGKLFPDSIGEPLAPEPVDTPERAGLATGLVERERHRLSEQRCDLTQAHLTLEQ